MSKDFAMLTATRRLANYLSREDFHLKKMAVNDRVSHSLFEKKVSHYNELVDILNDLFSILASNPSAKLFTHHEIGEKTDGQANPSNAFEEESIMDNHEDVLEQRVPEPAFIVSDSTVSTSENKPSIDGMVSVDVEPDDNIPVWESEGYDSRDAWLADKDVESTHTPDDLALGVNDAMSQHRAEQALEEYNETRDRDVDSYLPEDDIPVDVLPVDRESKNEEYNGHPVHDGVPVASSSDYDYMDHTVDNVRVDNDPIQIAAVETAVERYGEDGKKGTDIDLEDFIQQSKASLVENLLEDEFKRLRV